MAWHNYLCNNCKYEATNIDIKFIEQHGLKAIGKCPRCHANDWSRKPSAPNVQFRGSGFYEKHYKEKK